MLLPYDDNPNGPSGIRLGTPIITKNGMGAAEIDLISELVDTVLSNLKSSGHAIDQSVADHVRGQAKDLANEFPLRRPRSSLDISAIRAPVDSFCIPS